MADFDPLSGVLGDQQVVHVGASGDRSSPAASGAATGTSASGSSGVSAAKGKAKSKAKKSAAYDAVFGESKSTTGGLFDDDDEDDTAPAAPAAAAPPKKTPKPKKTGSSAADELFTADLSNVRIVKKIEKKKKKKKEKGKKSSQTVTSATSNVLGLGEDSEDDELQIRRKKAADDSLDDLFGMADAAGAETAAGDDEDNLFVDDVDSSSAPSSATASRAGSSNKGKYLKKMLQGEDTTDELDNDFSGLSVSKFMTTDVDTAGGLVDVNDRRKRLQKTKVLAEKTDESLLNVGDDGDLDAMADAIGGADLGAAGAGTGAADDDFDLFAIADDAAGDDTDDLFAMIDRPEQNATEETDVAQSLASIAQYIQGAE